MIHILSRYLCNCAYIFIHTETQGLNVYFWMCDGIDHRTFRATCAAWAAGVNPWEKYKKYTNIYLFISPEIICVYMKNLIFFFFFFKGSDVE